jgi:hypothetical protein
MQKFLGKINYLRQFILNLSGKISAFAPVLQLKNEVEFTWGADQQHAFDEIKMYLSSLPVMKAHMDVILFRLYITVEDVVIGGYFDANNGGQGTHHYILKLATHRRRNKVFFH